MQAPSLTSLASQARRFLVPLLHGPGAGWGHERAPWRGRGAAILPHAMHRDDVRV